MSSIASGFTRSRDDWRTADASPAAWTRGKLYYLLSNQLYIGRIKHHDQHFDGEHEPIIEAEQFAAVQALLAGQSARRKGSSSNEADIHRLTGIVFDETGDRLSPAYVTNHGKRYRYYVSARLKKSRRRQRWRLAHSRSRTRSGRRASARSTLHRSIALVGLGAALCLNQPHHSGTGSRQQICG